VCTHLRRSARARGSAVDNYQLAAWTRSGPVDFGASLTQYCCYFRTCCLALSVPRGLQELPTFVPPFAMCQRWRWSSVFSESCLCFYSACSSMGRRAGVDWRMGGLCPLPIAKYILALPHCFFNATSPFMPSRDCEREAKGKI
jgi:hypothetical protein